MSKNSTVAIGEKTSSSEEASKTVPSRKKGGISRARTIVLLVVFVSVLVGLVADTGWGGLSSMGVGAIAYLCPLGALETLVAGRSPVLRSVVSLVCVLAVIALIGRAFCSWICPVPPLHRFFHPNEGKKAMRGSAEAKGYEKNPIPGDTAVAAKGVAPLTTEETKVLSHSFGSSCASCSSCGLPPVGGVRDGLRIDSRHGVLLGAFVSSAVFGFPVFCLVCPVGLTFALGVGVYRAIFHQDPTVSLLLFAGILLVEVVFFRKWCHRLCPMGALMSLVGVKASLLRPRVSKEKCLREQGIDCQVCVKACPEQLDPHSKAIPECTKCGLCAEACPVGAISFRKRAAVPDVATAKAPEGGSAAPAVEEEFLEEPAL